MMTDVTQQFGSRLSYSVPRESENIIKEKARKSGLLPRVREAPLKDQLAARIKEFQNNVELMATLERKRSLDTQMLQRMQAEERMAGLKTTTSPPFRTGLADFAAAGRVAAQVANFVSMDDSDEDPFEAESVSTMPLGASEVSTATSSGPRPGAALQPTLDGRLAASKKKAQRGQSTASTNLGHNRNMMDWERSNMRDRSRPSDPRDTLG
jgi:hypothetical protein